MGLNSPNVLINALLWKVGTCFRVRGGEEFRTVRLDNFNICKTGTNTWEIIDHHSKSNQSGLCKSNSQRGDQSLKILTIKMIYSICYTFTKAKYILIVILLQAFGFNFQHVKVIKYSNVWFTKVPMGHNKLDGCSGGFW